MGNNQGSTKSPGPAASGRGVSSSFSFLNRQSQSSTRRSQIVVVNAAGQQVSDPNDDEHIKRLKETPRFMPLLKGCLPGHVNGPDVQKRIDPKPFIKFASRFQSHLAICAKVVSNEQSTVFSRIIQTDQAMSAVTSKLCQNGRHIEKLCEELKRVKDLQERLDAVDLLLQEIVPTIEILNEFLPEQDRLPPLSLLPKSSYTSIGHSTPSTPAISTATVGDSVEPGEEA